MIKKHRALCHLNVFPMRMCEASLNNNFNLDVIHINNDSFSKNIS